MKTARSTSPSHEQAMSIVNGATVQRARRERTYTTVSWDYPPSPAAYYNALLSRGASHSRFLRIAYLSTRERSDSSFPSSPIVSLSPTTTLCPSPAHLVSTPPSTSSAGFSRKQDIQPVPPYPLTRSCAHVRPRSANPLSHSLKRRRPQWPKPPHYHASLLRSPLSHRKGLFRAVLAPNKAVDFFRWDILFGAGVSLSAPRQERDRTRTSNVDACASLHVAEFVLEPYEAAAGFFGWHGLGLDVIRRVQGYCDEGADDACYWSEGVEVRQQDFGHDDAGKYRSLDLQLEIDEAVVDEGRARWARVAEELVGPPGLVLQWIVDKGMSDKATAPADQAHKASSSISSRREEVRWDPDIGPSPLPPSRPTSASEKKRPFPSSSMVTDPGSAPRSKPELQVDSPSAWWYAPSPTPHVPSFRLPPPPYAQYGPPPPQFPPYVPGGRVTSTQGHAHWYGAPPTGAPSVNRDPNLAKSHLPHSHSFTSPITPTSVHPSQTPWHPIKPSLGRNEYRQDPDCDKETEDHGYESTTTTTDSDPPPHTPIGATTTSHCVEALQTHGDSEVEGHGIEIDTGHAVSSMAFGLSDSTTSTKLPDRFSMSTSSSVSSGSPDSSRAGRESFKVSVVFPSLNGSFRQEPSSQTLASPSDQGIPRYMTPTRMATSTGFSSLPSAKKITSLGHDDGNSKMQLKDGDLEPSACSVLSDNPAFTLSLCSPPLTSPGSALRKDSQGFWEPATPISPCSSSSSSLLHSPSEGKAGSRPTTGWIGEKTGEGSESPGAASSHFTLTAKARSLSPGPRRVTGSGSLSSRPPPFSSPTSMGMFSGSYPSSPSPSSNSSLVPPNPTTLLPAFLATTTVKRKKTSRTREIVDRLRSSSIDAGKGGVGSDSLGWLASPSAGGELDGKTSSGSDHAAGGPPYKSSSDSKPDHDYFPSLALTKVSGSKTSDSCSSGPGSKSSGATSSESLSSLSTSKTTANPSITPFPILSVSQTLAFDFTTTHQRQTGVTTATPSKGGDRPKMNATVATSSNARIPGPQLLPGTLNGGAAPPTHPSHHSLPPPSHPTGHPQPALGPPPAMVAVSVYPHPMYVPVTQYCLTPPHQGQQVQGTWLAIYPGPPHLPVHPLPTQPHVPSITGVSGMRHVSW